MLDDEKPSGRHVSRHLNSSQHARGDNSPTVAYSPVAPTRTYPSTSSASSAWDKILSTEPKRRTIREKYSSRLHKIKEIAYDLSWLLIFIILTSVPYLNSYLFGPSAHSVNNPQSSMSGTVASFDYQTFLESLSEGDCFNLTAEPDFDSTAHFRKTTVTEGQVVDCSSIEVQYRFVGKTDISADDDWKEEQRATPGLLRTYWDGTGEQYNFIRLPYNGKLIIFNFVDDHNFLISNLYLSSDYTLPSDSAGVGLIEVSTDINDCGRDGGWLREVDGSDTCWTIVERK